MNRGVFPNWSGETVAVVAGGRSASHLAPALRGRCRIIAVNLAFRLVPDADVLYGADSGFWAHYPDAREFAGLKLSATDYAKQQCASVHLVKILKNVAGQSIPDLVREPLGVLGSGGGNGGFQAVNLAVQFGATTILLAGLDYTAGHWHPDHPSVLRNPTAFQLQKWAAVFDGQAKTLADWGVRVINLSKMSNLRAFPHGEPDRYLPHPRPAAL